MEPIHLIHIAPELPPTVGGVADYTAILSRRLVEVSDGNIEPTLMHAGWRKAETIDVDFPIVDLSGQCSASALANTIEKLAEETSSRTVVLLEYSGYGYAKRGAPLWLVRGARQACRNESVSILTMFHEISASGPVWSSAFWLSPVQSYVARQLSRLSSGIMTTHPTRADRLRGYVEQNAQIQVCPAFSNVGEPSSRPSFEGRGARAVVFGGGRTKKALYDTHQTVIQAGLERWGVETVVDVGPPEAAMPDALETKVEVRGVQPAEDIGQLLLNTRIGLLHYPAAHLTKSGIMAAYMAHGVVPVLVNSGPPGDVLESNTHFVSWSEESVFETGPVGATQVVRSTVQWYDQHAHSKNTADSVIDLIVEQDR